LLKNHGIRACHAFVATASEAGWLTVLLKDFSFSPNFVPRIPEKIVKGKLNANARNY